MKVKYWEVKYYAKEQRRYGTDIFSTSDLKEWKKEAARKYPHVDFYEYREIPKPTAQGGCF